MEKSHLLMGELEIHVQRILETHNPKQPYAQVLSVTEQRGGLISALARYIDERVEERIEKFARDLTDAARRTTTD
jgi:hypothetical protein